MLTENNQPEREDKKIVNTYFKNVIKGLKIRQVDKFQSSENEESCRLIRDIYGGESFSFKPISKNDIIEAVKKLPSIKGSISNDIRSSIIKSFAHCYSKILSKNFNDYVKENNFLNLMKIAEVGQFLKSSTTPLKTIIGLKVLYQFLLTF